DLATVDAGIMELDLAEVDIAATVDAAIEGLKDRIAETHIRVEKRIPATVGSFIGDGKRVRQILFNVIANAVGFSPEDGKVTVSVVRSGDAIEFKVADEGPGIPADFVARAFEPFASLPRGSSRGGAGLGLSIVRSFVRLHGGTVKIDSVEGKGS